MTDVFHRNAVPTMNAWTGDLLPCDICREHASDKATDSLHCVVVDANL